MSVSRANNAHYSRLRRRFRIRKKIKGTSERPRVSFFKSSRHLYVQAIDDDKGVTLQSISSFGKNVPSELKDSSSVANISMCSLLGKLFAKKCMEKGISTVVFDRGGFAYHGRVKAFADAAREGGLKF